MDLQDLRHAVVQLSLDLTSIDEAIETAAVAVDAGVDWLEAGTPLLLADGLHAVEKLRAKFPKHPIVADLKTMDGGYLEAEMMAKAGADFVVVMGRAHEATIRRVIEAGRDFNVRVMGDNLGADDRVGCAKWMADLGVDVVVHHIGFDERGMIRGASGLDSGPGRRRSLDRSGDRVRASGCATGSRGRSIGDRRRLIPAGGWQPLRQGETDL